MITLGPPPADDVLREAIAWGANAGIHLCDENFAGSDTLATARALAAALAQTARSTWCSSGGIRWMARPAKSGLAYASSVRELAISVVAPEAAQAAPTA